VHVCVCEIVDLFSWGEGVEFLVVGGFDRSHPIVSYQYDKNCCVYRLTNILLFWWVLLIVTRPCISTK